jgi:hypothetical protein
VIAGGSNGLAFLLQVIKDLMAPPDQAAPPKPAVQPVAEGVQRKAAFTASTASSPVNSRYFRARLTTG